ncbi:MAG: LamG-like jellyroll fold domain-containing protein [Pseudolysinimonas sp.]
MAVSSVAWAYWLAASTTGSNGASAATSVNAGATPTTSVSTTSVTVSWAASTLANGQAVTGYQIKRYDANTLVLQTIKTACTGTVATTSCVESAVPDGTWKYSVTPVIGTNWRGAESAKSATAMVDTVAPTNAITLSNITGGAFKSGNTIYYNGGSAGSFTLTNAVTDALSGPASSQTAALTGTSTGWTHTGSTVSSPAGGPYASAAFSWVATTTGPGEVVTGRDVAGNSTTTSLSLLNDTTAPSTGTVTYAAGPVGSTSLSVSFTTGTDAGAGIGTRLLQRASATLLSGTCGSYSAFATVTGGTNPTSPVVDTVSYSNCYQYRYVVSDNVGNTATATNTNVATTPYGAYYAFDAGSGTTAVDSTGDLFTGTLQSAAGWTTGKIGSNALNLTGVSNSWMTVPNPVIDSSQSYTVATWVKLTGFTGANQTFASIDGTTISPFYLQLNTSNKFNFAQRGSDSTGAALAQVTSPATATLATWYYVAGVYNSSTSTIELFVNGVSQGTATSVAAWKATGSTTVGRAKWNSGNVDFVNGALDETRFYDRVLSADELTALAGAYSTRISATPGLLSYWRLGEASGTTAVDAKAVNNGTYINAPTLGVAGAITNDPNTAATFNGTTSFVNVARQISTDFSIEFWFNSTQSYSNDLGNPHCTRWWQGAALVDADSGGGANDFGISLCSGKVIGGVGGNPDPSIASTATYNDGAWHYVVMTRTQSTGLVELYVDGASVGTVTGTTNALTSTPAINFGRSTATTNYLAGTLDEIAMYNVALPAATIASHYVDAR